MSTSLKIFVFVFLQFVISAFYTNFLSAQLVPDFKVNDDTTNMEQYEAKIGVDSFGNFVVVWTDFRKEGLEGVNVNLYCQRLSPNGGLIGNNFRINEVSGTSSSPSISVRKNGSFLVCWKDFSIRYRLFNSIGIPYSQSFILNDSIVNRGFNTPSAGTDSSGNFVICWQEYVFGQPGNIYFQKLDSLGNKIGINIKVNDDTGNNTHNNPAITVRQDGSFIVTWNDTRPPAMDNADDIYMQMYDRFGNKIGVNTKINDDSGIFNLQHSPKISSDSIGNVIIAWNDDRLDNTYNEVYGQKFYSNGSQFGVNFRVTQGSIDIVKGISSVDKRANGDFIICWTEFRNIPQPYFQRFLFNGAKIGGDYLVSSEASLAEKISTDGKIFGDKIISLWTDIRKGNRDIYCNMRSFTNPDTTVNIIQTSTLIPEGFTLYQNYPNPFNSTSVFSFSIKVSDIYKFEIYNSLGQKVNEVFNKLLNPGSYKINYSSGLLASGAYYYILSSQKKKQAKVFVILK